MLYPTCDGSCQHRRLCRGRRDHAAGRGEADFFGLDVCRKPRPAWRRASDLRYLADRLQSPGHHRRQRPTRYAKAAAPGSKKAVTAEAGAAAASAATSAPTAAAPTTTSATAAAAVRWPVRDFPAITRWLPHD